MIQCTLCGEFYDVGRVFVSVQTVACDQCVSKLLDDETDRRAGCAEPLRVTHKPTEKTC